MSSQPEPCPSLLRSALPYLNCRCGAARWQMAADRLVCAACAFAIVVEEGVICVHGSHRDRSTDFYAVHGGPRFVGTAFADNVHIFAATRAYRRILDEWFPAPAGPLLDLGCGDGRLSLWALENGFSPVVAVDASLESVRRLAAAARERGLQGLIPIAASMQDAPLKPRVFNAILCVEVLYYLAGPEGRTEVLRQISAWLAPDGLLVLSEFTRNGRLLADVVAMNVENMRRTAYQGTRHEKYADAAVEVSHPTPEELRTDCIRAGLHAVAARGVSPITMLFQHAYNFTSYPLRPRLDPEMQKLIERLDDQSSDACSFSRNLVLLLRRAGNGA